MEIMDGKRIRVVHINRPQHGIQSLSLGSNDTSNKQMWYQTDHVIVDTLAPPQTHCELHSCHQ